MNTKPLLPPLKWAGGKRQIIDTILANLPSQWDRKCDRYYEPFLGGGAVLFALQPSFAIASDINPELINFYDVIRNNLDMMQITLKDKDFANEKTAYLSIRDSDRYHTYWAKTDIYKAARFLYLNKHGFRGLCRYNASGQFNVPYGHYKQSKDGGQNEAIDYDWGNLERISRYLNSNEIQLLSCSWRRSLFNEYGYSRNPLVNKGDFVYLDPPYDPLSNTSNFVGYSNHGFSKVDQLALKEGCDKLTCSGAYIMQSNAATPFILNLYKEYRQLILPVKRQINPSEKREN